MAEEKEVVRYEFDISDVEAKTARIKALTDPDGAVTVAILDNEGEVRIAAGTQRVLDEEALADRLADALQRRGLTLPAQVGEPDEKLVEAIKAGMNQFEVG